jgi:hypothetical protein
LLTGEHGITTFGGNLNATSNSVARI